MACRLPEPLKALRFSETCPTNSYTKTWLLMPVC
jgi:hypothetical protein